jgi:hypothetical protein
MDRAEAKRILARELEGYRGRSYRELLRLLEVQDTREVSGPGGTLYQLEFQALWDDRGKGHLRVMGAIDDGGWRVFLPLTDDFIIGPDGRFIGE